MDIKKAKLLLGKRIKQLRKEQGLTQEAVSERSGTVTEKRWSDIERGRYSVGLNILLKIAKGLNVPLQELFRFEDVKRQRTKNNYFQRKISNLEKQLFKTDKEMGVLKKKLRELRGSFK